MAHNISFKYAWEGTKYAFSTQPNFKVHAVIGALTIISGVVFRVSQTEWLFLILAITLVITAEMANTAIESMTDLIEEKHHKHAKIAKDVSAGMVLLTAIAAVIIGLAIFAPKLLVY